MKPLRFEHALRISVAAAVLVGCGGAQPPTSVPAAMPQSRSIAQHAARGESWMLSAAKNDSLVYASIADVVSIYSFPQGTEVGELKGFPSEPAGLCSDSSGNVYVTTQGGGTSDLQSYILEYAHGGTKPIATYDDPGLANGCAVDPVTGDLAVANYFGAGVTQGNLAIYQAAQGPPSIFSDANFSRFLWCAYDDAGNLFADGGPETVIDELSRGSDSLNEIQLSKPINAGSMQWTRNRILVAELVGSRGDNPIYEVRVSGSQGAVSGPVLLSSSGGRSAAGDIQFWLEKKTMIGPGHADGENTLLQFWKYPKGGLPTKVIHYERKVHSSASPSALRLAASRQGASNAGPMF